MVLNRDFAGMPSVARGISKKFKIFFCLCHALEVKFGPAVLPALYEREGMTLIGSSQTQKQNCAIVNSQF